MTTKQQTIWAVALLGIVAMGAVLGLYRIGHDDSQGQLRKVVINEAARTLVYIPIYNAIEKRYFRDEGLDVQIVTGGTPTAAFSAMLTGNADFASSDPMFVPISRQKGAQTKVVAQIVARIAAWALTNDPNIRDFSRATIQQQTISTVQRPTTWYTYTANYLRSLGLTDGQNVTILQNRSGSELAPFLAHRAEFVVTAEPGTSIAERAGAHVVYSWPAKLGDRIFTGLSTRMDMIQQHRDIVLKMDRALQRSLDDLYAHPSDAISTARIYFPSVPQDVLQGAMDHLLRDKVVPSSVAISEKSWRDAVGARREAGDLTSDAPYSENVAGDVISEALRSK